MGKEKHRVLVVKKHAIKVSSEFTFKDFTIFSCFQVLEVVQMA